MRLNLEVGLMVMITDVGGKKQRERELRVSNHNKYKRLFFFPLISCNPTLLPIESKNSNYKYKVDLLISPYLDSFSQDRANLCRVASLIIYLCNRYFHRLNYKIIMCENGTNSSSQMSNQLLLYCKTKADTRSYL